MRLCRQKALLLAAALTMACHESTGPPHTVSGQTVSGLNVLESVNGRPVPAFVYASLADTTFILWATLTLDTAGNAFRAEHWRRVNEPNRTDEGIFTIQKEYWRENHRRILQAVPINALCEGNKVGKLTSTTLTLAYESPTAPLYRYRLAQTY